MKNIAKIGGIAALIEAATYIFGMVILFTYLSPPDFSNNDPDMLQKVGFLVDNSTLVYIWNVVIFVVNAIFLAVLAVALYQRLQIKTSILAQLSLTIGSIWATLVLGAGMVANVGFAEVVRSHETDAQAATSLWHIVHTIENGLGGGNEITDGVWALVLGMGFLASKWFVWVGIALLRPAKDDQTQTQG